MAKPIQKHAWEYLPENTGIPKNIQNTSDSNQVQAYLADHQNDLTETEREYLTHKQDSLKKISEKTQLISKQVEEGTYESHPAEVVSLDENSYLLFSLSQPSYQTASNGCWSCFMNLALQSRGINDLSQEDIRAFRPQLGPGEAFGQNADLDMNTDVKSNVLDHGDLFLDLLPDTMVRSTEIWSYHKYKTSQKEKENYIKGMDYSNKVVDAVKQQILEAIRDHKSPVGLMMDGHYVTVIGIEGNIIHYKNSMPGDNDNPDETFTANLQTFLDKALNGENADAISLTWIEDIKLSKDGKHLYHATNPKATVDENGTVSANAEEDQSVFFDERQKKGTMIGSTGGIDVADKKASFRTHLTDGFFKIDKTYLPSKVNLNSLKQKAALRSEADEQALENNRQQALAAERKVKEDIRYLAGGVKDAPIEPVDERAGRFKLESPIKVKPLFVANSFYEFRQLAGSLGWNKEEDAILLASLGHMYGVHQNLNDVGHNKALNIVFRNNLLLHGDNDDVITVREKRFRLETLYRSMKYGSDLWDDDGYHHILRGFGEGPLSENVTKSIQYVESYLTLLRELEKVNPRFDASDFNLDQYINEQGQPLVAELKGTHRVKEAIEHNRQVQVLQQSHGRAMAGAENRNGFDGSAVAPGNANPRPQAGAYVGDRNLLQEADPQNYTGFYGLADRHADPIGIVGEGGKADFDFFLEMLAVKGLSTMGHQGTVNTFRAMYNLFKNGGEQYEALFQTAFIEPAQLSQENLVYALVDLYQMTDANPVPDTLQESVQCIRDAMCYRAERAFKRIETAYLSGDAQKFANELITWEADRLVTQENYKKEWNYSTPVAQALVKFKEEIVSCQPDDERYGFYLQVKQEIQKMQVQAQQEQSVYVLEACGQFMDLAGHIVAQAPASAPKINIDNPEESFNLFNDMEVPQQPVNPSQNRPKDDAKTQQQIQPQLQPNPNPAPKEQVIVQDADGGQKQGQDIDRNRDQEDDDYQLFPEQKELERPFEGEMHTNVNRNAVLLHDRDKEQIDEIENAEIDVEQIDEQPDKDSKQEDEIRDEKQEDEIREEKQQNKEDEKADEIKVVIEDNREEEKEEEKEEKKEEKEEEINEEKIKEEKEEIQENKDDEKKEEKEEKEEDIIKAAFREKEEEPEYLDEYDVIEKDANQKQLEKEQKKEQNIAAIKAGEKEHKEAGNDNEQIIELKEKEEPDQKNVSLPAPDESRIKPGQDRWMTMDELRSVYKRKLETMERAAKEQPLNPDNDKDVKKAAEAVVYAFLQTEGAKKSFFGHTTNRTDDPDKGLLLVNEQGRFSGKKVKNNVAAMVDQILLESNVLIFVMQAGATPGQMYERLRNHRRRNLDSEVQQAWKEEEKDKKKRTGLGDRQDPVIRLSDEEMKQLKRTRKELKELYAFDGRFRSEYMERLYNKLDEVIEGAKDTLGMVKTKDLQSIKNKALVYYDKRKGILMGPITDKGKARLEIVEGLADNVNKMMIRERMPEKQDGIRQGRILK